MVFDQIANMRSSSVLMQRVVQICLQQLILAILKRQGLRLLLERATRPPIFGPGCTITSVPPIIWGVTSSQVTTSVPFNHEVVMVKIRNIFNWFTLMLTKKFHLLGDYLSQTPYQGSAPVPRWESSTPQTCYVPQPWSDACVRPTCNMALNAEYYTNYCYLLTTCTGFHYTLGLHTAASCNGQVCFS